MDVKKEDMGKLCIVKYIDETDETEYEHEVGILLESVNDDDSAYSVFILSDKFVDSHVEQNQIVDVGISVTMLLKHSSLVSAAVFKNVMKAFSSSKSFD